MSVERLSRDYRGYRVVLCGFRVYVEWLSSGYRLSCGYHSGFILVLCRCSGFRCCCCSAFRSLLLLVLCQTRRTLRCRDVRFGFNRLDRRRARRKARRRNERVCKMAGRNVGMMYRRVAKLRLKLFKYFCWSAFMSFVGRTVIGYPGCPRLSDGMYV